MAGLAEQIERAIAIGLDATADPALRQEAVQFFDSVKFTPEAYKTCLEAFAATPARPAQVRFVCLQLLEDVVGSRIDLLGAAELDACRQEMWAQMTHKLSAEEPAFIRNKVAHVLALVFKLQFTNGWPGFFDDLIQLVEQNAGGARAVLVADMFCRVCEAVDDEIANPLVARSAADAAAGTALKDAMRVAAVANLTREWFRLLAAYSANETDLTNRILRLFGQYVAWVDLNLVFNESLLSAVFAFLQQPALQVQACLTLVEIVAKGMGAAERLALVRALDAPQLLARLSLASAPEDFAVAVAKLVNILGVRLLEAALDSDTAGSGGSSKSAGNGEATVDDAGVRAGLLAQQEALFPYAVEILGLESEEVAQVVYPYVDALLKMFKKPKSGAPANPTHVRELATAIMRRMRLPADLDVDPDVMDAGDDEQEALEVRKTLRSALDAIVSVDAALYEQLLASYATDVLERISAARGDGRAMEQAVPFSEVELALYCIFLFGEGRGSAALFATPAAPGAERAAGAMLPLGRLLSLMVTSGVSGYPHTLVALLYHENVHRYVQFFDQHPEFAPAAFEAFTDARGLHHASLRVRSRVMYLFARFLRHIRHRYSSRVLVAQFLQGVQPLLEVRVPAAAPDAGGKTGHVNKTYIEPQFEAQLYLYEATAMMIGQDTVPAPEQTAYAEAVLAPLLAAMQTVSGKAELEAEIASKDGSGTGPLVLLLHHVITACGSFARGFSAAAELSGALSASGPGKGTVKGKSDAKTESTELPLAPAFLPALEGTLFILERCRAAEAIREGSRYTYQRLIPVLGAPVVPLFRTLAQHTALGDATCGAAVDAMREAVDLLPCLELLMHRFRPAVRPMLDALLGPLIENLFRLFNVTVQGTDEQRVQAELKRAFLNLLIYVFSSDLSSVLTSETNAPRLPSVLEAVRVLALDAADPQVQRGAFMVFSRMVTAWCASAPAGELVALPGTSAGDRAPGSAGSSAEDLPGKIDGEGSSGSDTLPGFEQYVYECIVRAAFEAPLSKSFRLSDGGAFLVLGEIAALHRAILRKQGRAYLQYLASAFLPQLGCTPAAAQEFADRLCTLDARGLRKYLVTFFQRLLSSGALR